jgi:hypothetical protein
MSVTYGNRAYETWKNRLIPKQVDPKQVDPKQVDPKTG